MSDRQNQSAAILEYLQSGATLTPLEALDRFGSMRLGARIYDLKKQGHPIKVRIIELRSGKHVAQYYIEPLTTLFEM